MAAELVCYCFRYTEADIREDVRAHGTSTILARIVAAKREGACQCALTNPKGR